MRIESYGSAKIYWPDFSRDELIELLREKARRLAELLPLERVMLFGSWAHDQATAFSDVDVLVVYTDPKRDQAYEIAYTTMQVEGLEAHVYCESDAAKVKPALSSMIRDGAIDLLTGAETIAWP